MQDDDDDKTPTKPTVLQDISGIQPRCPPVEREDTLRISVSDLRRDTVFPDVEVVPPCAVVAKRDADWRALYTTSEKERKQLHAELKLAVESTAENEKLRRQLKVLNADRLLAQAAFEDAAAALGHAKAEIARLREMTGTSWG